MPLIDLKTNLKSLKYGNDQPGGGSSDQPYIKVDINNVDSGFNRFRMAKLDDGLVRGGIVGAANAAVTDTFRIGKFLTDLPKGPLWIVKQVGLQLSNPKLESRAPKTGIGFIDRLATVFNDKIGIGPTRIYNLGINTLAQVPVNALGIHFNRHGLLPVQDDNTKYLAVVKNNNLSTGTTNAKLSPNSTNRLLKYTEKLLPVSPPKIKPTGFLKQLLSLIPGASLFIKPQQMMIDEYIGGPGSVYGIGKTFIKRYDYTSNGINNQQPQNKGEVNYYNVLGLSTQYFTPYSNPITNPKSVGLLFGTQNASALSRQGLTPTGIITSTPNQIRVSNNIDINNPTAVPSQINNNTAVKYAQNIPAGANGTSNSPTLRKYQELRSQIDLQKTLTNNNSVGIYNSSYDGTKIDNTKGNYNTTNLGAGNIQYQNSYGEVVKIKGYSSWNEVTRENRVGDFGNAKYLSSTTGASGSVVVTTKTVRAADQINLTPLFEVPGTSKSIGDKITINNTEFLIRDLVKFRIQAVNGDDPTKTTYMVFRAYVTQYSDSVNANWNNVKYAGRGENFYIYGGFDRSISINFKVAALSAVEMEPMYQKLNYLMGNLMPDYKDNLLMRGPMTRMTIGNWLDGQDGVITALTYNVPQDSPWEISLGEDVTTGVNTLNLPHIVEVNMTFLPIGSQTKGENKISSKSSTTSHIAQNVNDYQFIGNKYTSNNKIPQGT
jgi:hypothetical protein